MPAEDPSAPLDGRPLDACQALVLGAGVAGLAAAVALRQRGARVSVLEQSPRITEVGAGLQISPNGTRVLEALGIDPQSLGDRSEAVELRDQQGHLVTRLDLPQDGPGFWLCHRADLIAGLENRCRALETPVQLLQKVERITLCAGGAEVTTAVGATYRTPLLIGADGLHSPLRQTLNPRTEPFFTGQVAWRATIPGDGGPKVAQVFMGPGRHLVSYPLRGGSLRNIVAVQERAHWAAEGWNHEDDPAALRAAFAGFGGPVPGWLAQIEQLFLWGLFRHPVAPYWQDGEGRAALLGDAAHPTLPFMAQGANMALEDAYALAAQLSACPEAPEIALKRYQTSRAPRVAKIVAAANANARNYHLKGPMAALAHAILRSGNALAPRMALKRFDWIYRHDVTA